MKIKAIHGEIKLSHKKKDLGITVSTKEFIIQKPHVNYHVPLDSIVSILPADGVSWKSKTIINAEQEISQQLKSYSGVLNHFRIHATKANMHNRSGIFELGSIELVIPVHPDMLKYLVEYSELLRI